MISKQQFQSLKAYSALPDVAQAQWLAGAADSIQFLITNALSDAVVLYASMPCVWIMSAMALNEKLDPIDRKDLREARLQLDDTWVIQKSYGGGKGYRVYLEPPLAYGSASLEGGELPVYRRTFHGMDRVEPFELNQRLVHSLGIFFVEHRSAYCRWDENGDFEDVITIHSDENADPYSRREMITIRSKDLGEYLALSGTSLVRRFDFTRLDRKNFTSWGEVERSLHESDDLSYNSGVASTGSWANGYQLIRTQTTAEDLSKAFEAESLGQTKREYEKFIAWDWKNQKLVETSCSPEATANYFTKSDLPFDVTPAFFRPEVLARYKADPDKYNLDDRSISCRNAWHLKTYDINEAGQVHTYLCYLADLPIAEQRYWKAFNEPPKANISRRAVETDFQGEWPSQYDPLVELKQKVETLNSSRVPWWSQRSGTLLETTHYPATESKREWADEILALDQLVVEGFVETKLKRCTVATGAAGTARPGSLNALTVALRAFGVGEVDAIEIVRPLKTLHHLRSKVRGHSSHKEADQLTKDILMKHGSFRAHFFSLVSDCDLSLGKILAVVADDPENSSKK